MGNVRFPQYWKKKQKDAEILKGWELGAWTVLSIFMDKYEVSGDEGSELLEESMELLKSFGTGEFNPEYIFRELQKKTGIFLHVVD